MIRLLGFECNLPRQSERQAVHILVRCNSSDAMQVVAIHIGGDGMT